MELTADESSWELYQFDRQGASADVYNPATCEQRTAQALYTFIESLPERPIPLSFARIKRRLMLTSPNNQQNRVINNKAIDELKASVI